LGKYLNAFSATGKFNTNDLADMVTSIYANTENLALLIGWVALASCAVLRGDTDRSAVFTALRKRMTYLLSIKDSHPMTDYDPIDTILASGKR